MAERSELYAEVKADIQTIADPLFEFSELCLRRRGNFVPHGAVLGADGKVGVVAAAPENEVTNSTEVLPILHEALRALAKERELIAIGVAENVTVSRDGQPSTDAIKVLFEHKRGLVTALYLPFKRRFMGGYSFGEVFSVAARGEVNAWQQPIA